MTRNPSFVGRGLACVSLLVAVLAISAARADGPNPAPAAPAAAVVAAAGTPPAAAPRAPSADRAVDRLQLDTTSITGNRELPKVMSIVPWKAAEPPAGPDRPMGSLIEELLAPLDRDEFRREITYYRDLTSQSATPTTVASPGAQ
jgi:hypothetical protein